MATRYVDNTKETGTLTGSSWQFTNSSTTVTETGSNGNAQAELSAGDYVRTNGGIQWYKVASVTDDDNFEITPAFQQSNNTDTCKNNSEDGTATGNAFCHLNQATTDEVRSPNDIIKVRANQTHTYAGDVINFDEDGGVASLITLKGCDSVDDPWSDGSDVRPIIDFADTDGRFYPSEDNWRFEHLDFTGGNNASNGCLTLYLVEGLIFEDCQFYDNGSDNNGAAIKCTNRGQALIVDCTFENNYGYSISVQIGSQVTVFGCVFNGGAPNGTRYGVLASGSAPIYIKDSTFGVTSDHSVGDLYAAYSSRIFGRNVKLDSATEVVLGSSHAQVYLEDDEQTHEAFRAWTGAGNLTRTTAVNRSGGGGSPWSILGEGNSDCGAENALYLIGDRLRGLPIYLDGTEQTITVYAYALSWISLPTASEFVVEIEHYESSGTWDIDTTTDTFAANGQWESFSITLTPGAAGPAALRVYLTEYEDGSEEIYIDAEPAIT